MDAGGVAGGTALNQTPAQQVRESYTPGDVIHPMVRVIS